MQMILMLLAFAAVVLLVLALYPVVMRQITGESSGGVAEAVSRQDVQKKYSYPLIGCAAVFAVLLISGIDFVVTLIASLAVGVLAFMLMSRIMTSRKRKREAFFESRMLDFLVLVCNNLRSGFALPNSIDTAAKSIGGVLGAEFNIMLSEYRLGMELSEAIRRMNKRVDSENLQLFSATVSIAIRTGSSISSVLERLILTIRKRNDISDKLAALTAQFRFEATVMALFPFLALVVLYLIDPELMAPMVTTLVGWVTIGCIIVLEMIGFFILKKICTVQM
jgi:tight adherence protein B